MNSTPGHRERILYALLADQESPEVDEAVEDVCISANVRMRRVNEGLINRTEEKHFHLGRIYANQRKYPQAIIPRQSHTRRARSSEISGASFETSVISSGIDATVVTGVQIGGGAEPLYQRM